MTAMVIGSLVILAAFAVAGLIEAIAGIASRGGAAPTSQQESLAFALLVTVVLLACFAVVVSGLIGGGM